MIKGVPLKFPVDTADGKDMTTLYFATAKSAPELAGLVKDMRKQASTCEKLKKKLEFVVKDWDTATPETLDAIFDRREALVDEAESMQESIETTFSTFIVTALVKAGYTAEAAESVKHLVPLDRFGEIWNAIRVGAPMADFSQAT